MQVIRKMKESQLLKKYWSARWTTYLDDSMLVQPRGGQPFLVKKVMYGK